MECGASYVSDSPCCLLGTLATAHTQAEPLARRYDLLAAYRQCLLLLGEDDLHDGDADLVELARLGPKIKTLDFPLCEAVCCLRSVRLFLCSCYCYAWAIGLFCFIIGLFVCSRYRYA